MDSGPLILVTGATGYVGGLLWRLLEGQGRRVRCLVRRPEAVAPKVCPSTEVVQGDGLDRESLNRALAGVDTAYYLIHSMGAGGEFEEQDRTAARNFGAAARGAGVRRIIYLGGLGHGEELSPHLRSRQEVGDLLREAGVPVIEFRASIVLGAGSLSFEMIRALVERLPVMITPRWVEVLAQPIAVDDLLAYLVAALERPSDGGGVFEIGGADQVSYGELMREYARRRGLRRWMIRVPLLTPRLSSLWLGLVTPLYARVGRKLIESIRHPTVVRDPIARTVFPIQPMGVREALARIMDAEPRAKTRWFDALSSGGSPPDWTGARFKKRRSDARTRRVDVGREAAFAPIRRIGGETGWYACDFLWRARGFLDLLVGGVGVRRGRPDPESLSVGDAVDFWRVEAYEPDRLLRLSAEMKLPGRAWLQFEVEPDGTGTMIRQTAHFDPIGFWGLAYWYGIYPLHAIVFAGMLRNIARAAEGTIASRPV